MYYVLILQTKGPSSDHPSPFNSRPSLPYLHLALPNLNLFSFVSIPSSFYSQHTDFIDFPLFFWRGSSSSNSGLQRRNYVSSRSNSFLSMINSSPSCKREQEVTLIETNIKTVKGMSEWLEELLPEIRRVTLYAWQLAWQCFEFISLTQFRSSRRNCCQLFYKRPLLLCASSINRDLNLEFNQYYILHVIAEKGRQEAMVFGKSYRCRRMIYPFYNACPNCNLI